MEDQRDNPNIIGSEIIIYQTEDGYTKPTMSSGPDPTGSSD